MSDKDLSPHCKKVLEVLHKSSKPMSAYELLDKLHKFGIKAPPTVYRALETLMERGLVHRIETLGAFVACHDKHGDHGAQFAVCRACGTVEEIHDHRLTDAIAALGQKLKFHIEREMLELMGLCQVCAQKVKEAYGMFYWSALKRMTAACLLLACLWAMTFWAMGKAVW